MVRTKKVRFDFFQAVTVDENNNPCLFDLTTLIHSIRNLPIQQRIMSLQGEQVKLDNVLDYDNGETYFHMSRYRDEGLAAGTIDSDDIEDIDLDDDQYIIEDIGCLFDPEFSALMIQRNYHSLSITGVQDYLSNMYRRINTSNGRTMTDTQEQKITNFGFDFVPDINVYERVSRANRFRTISFKAGTLDEDPITPGLIQRLVGPFNTIKNNYGGYNVSIIISAEPHGKNLDTEASLEFKDMVRDNETMFSSAIIRAAEGDAPIEPFDLINGRLFCYERFSITILDEDTNRVKKIHLNQNSVEESMNRKYNLADAGNYKEKVRAGLRRN